MLHTRQQAIHLRLFQLTRSLWEEKSLSLFQVKLLFQTPLLQEIVVLLEEGI